MDYVSAKLQPSGDFFVFVCASASSVLLSYHKHSIQCSDWKEANLGEDAMLYVIRIRIFTWHTDWLWFSVHTVKRCRVRAASKWFLNKQNENNQQLESTKKWFLPRSVSNFTNWLNNTQSTLSFSLFFSTCIVHQSPGCREARDD